jgi:flagellar protein FlgJ
VEVVTKEAFCSAVYMASPAGVVLRREALAVLWAHHAHETVGGTRCPGWNLAGIRAGKSWTGLRVGITTFEYIDGVRETQTGQAFRAYATLDEAAADYLRFLYAGRYVRAWERALAGDLDGFCSELKRAGYFTAPVADYMRGLRHWHARYMTEA